MKQLTEQEHAELVADAQAWRQLRTIRGTMPTRELALKMVDELHAATVNYAFGQRPQNLKRLNEAKSSLIALVERIYHAGPKDA